LAQRLAGEAQVAAEELKRFQPAEVVA